MAFDLPEDCDPRIRAIHDYWHSIQPAEGLPGRKNVDPLDIPELLTHVWMADIERDPFRVRFRLIGSAIVTAVDKDLTGQYFDECFSDFEGSGTHETVLDVCRNGEPAWRRGPALLTRTGYNVKEIERIFLPLAADGKTVDMLLAVSVYTLKDGSR